MVDARHYIWPLWRFFVYLLASINWRRPMRVGDSIDGNAPRGKPDDAVSVPDDAVSVTVPAGRPVGYKREQKAKT